MQAQCLGLLRLLGISLLAPMAAHAQNQCPQGQYQALPPGTPGPGRCVPVPRNLQGVALPLPQAATHWGAIAADATNGHFGAAHDLPSKRAAKEQALAQCRRDGGTHCTVATAYGNGCGALIAGDMAWRGFADVTFEHAKQTGIEACKKGGNENCRVVYSDCSPGQ